MNLRNILNNILVFVLLVACMFLSSKRHQERKALDACIDDISSNCHGLFNYAVALEEENSKLNVLYKECMNK